MTARDAKPYGGRHRASFQSPGYQDAVAALYGKPHQRSPLPPYGREVEAALAVAEHPNVRIYACRPDPWGPARSHRHTFGAGTVMVLPVDAAPTSLRWPPVRNLLADITGLPGDTLHDLARALVRHGCRLAYLLDRDYPERNLRVVAVKRAS